MREKSSILNFNVHKKTSFNGWFNIQYVNFGQAVEPAERLKDSRLDTAHFFPTPSKLNPLTDFLRSYDKWLVLLR